MTAIKHIDLEKLDQYIVVPLTRKALGSFDDLRELDGDFGHGVYALWSDDAQTLVAFVFDDVTWKREDALAWVKDAKANGAKALTASGAAMVFRW